MQASITVNEVCHYIVLHKDCPGITAEQIKALCQGGLTFSFSIQPIIEAIRKTEYYKQFCPLTKETLSTLPSKEWQPIHELFNKFS